MARSQAELHELLKTLTTHVYFQPPTRMQYPCIKYERDFAETAFADNAPYRFTQRYAVTVIDRDPNSDLPGKVAMLPMSSFNRHFTADGLNHDVYTLFF